MDTKDLAPPAPNDAGSIKDFVRWHGGRGLYWVWNRHIPWLSQTARARLEDRSYGRDLVPTAAIQKSYSDAIQWLEARVGPDGLLGDYLEFGVCTGASMTAMFHTLELTGHRETRLFGFDSFEGLPPEAADQDNGVWKAGSFMSSRERTEELMAAAGVDLARVELVEGWFSDTCTPELRKLHTMETASVIMVDCDIYSAAVEALDFVEPLITGPTVIMFDDWNSMDLAAAGQGEARAWREFSDRHPHIVVVDELSSYNYNSHIICVDRRG